MQTRNILILEKFSLKFKINFRDLINAIPRIYFIDDPRLNDFTSYYIINHTLKLYYMYRRVKTRRYNLSLK